MWFAWVGSVDVSETRAYGTLILLRDTTDLRRTLFVALSSAEVFAFAIPVCFGKHREGFLSGVNGFACAVCDVAQRFVADRMRCDTRGGESMGLDLESPRLQHTLFWCDMHTKDIIPLGHVALNWYRLYACAHCSRGTKLSA